MGGERSSYLKQNSEVDFKLSSLDDPAWVAEAITTLSTAETLFPVLAPNPDLPEMYLNVLGPARLCSFFLELLLNGL